MSEETSVAVGLFDRYGCKDCAHRGEPLKTCFNGSIDLTGECIVCDVHEDTPSANNGARQEEDAS